MPKIDAVALDDLFCWYLTAIADYVLTLAPHSASVLVKYTRGAPRCLDEDEDGFGAHPTKLADCPGL